MNLMGIDVGTSSIKTAIFNEKLEMLRTSNIDYLIEAHDNIVEFVNGYDFDKVIVTKKGNAPYIMAWPEIKEDVYFNIVID